MGHAELVGQVCAREKEYIKKTKGVGRNGWVLWSKRHFWVYGGYWRLWGASEFHIVNRTIELEINFIQTYLAVPIEEAVEKDVAGRTGA